MAKAMVPAVQRHHHQIVDVVRRDSHQLQISAQIGTIADDWVGSRVVLVHTGLPASSTGQTAMGVADA